MARYNIAEDGECTDHVTNGLHTSLYLHVSSLEIIKHERNRENEVIHLKDDIIAMRFTDVCYFVASAANGSACL